MFWHIDTDIVSLIVIAAIYFYSRRLSPQDETGPQARRFSRCLEIGIAVTVIDIAASLAMELPVSRFVYHLMMTLNFISMELVILEWVLYVLTILYVDNVRRGAAIGRCFIAVYCVFVLFVCVNPWTKLIYSLGPGNQYSRGPFFAVMVVLYALFTLVLLVLIIIRWKNIPKTYPWVVLATPLLIGCAIAVQLTTPGWLMIMPSYMLCLLLAYLFFQNIRFKNSEELMASLSRVAETDPLTGLYNRFGMEMMVKKTLDEAFGRRVLVLITDIDDLKQINDSMGHAQGDRAIKLVAGQLKKHFRSDDTVVRYGGDEFLAFLTGLITVDSMTESLSRLSAELRALSIGENDDVPLHSSIGAAFGIVGTDSFQSLCDKADIALYHVKRTGKDGFAFYHSNMEQEELSLARSAAARQAAP